MSSLHAKYIRGMKGVGRYGQDVAGSVWLQLAFLFLNYTRTSTMKFTTGRLHICHTPVATEYNPHDWQIESSPSAK